MQYQFLVLSEGVFGISHDGKSAIPHRLSGTPTFRHTHVQGCAIFRSTNGVTTMMMP
jgi:hypothetical protein